MQRISHYRFPDALAPGAESRHTTGCVMSRLSASEPHRSSLRWRLRPRENAVTLLRGARACLALLAVAALLALAAPAQAQTEVWSATLTPQVISNSGTLGCKNSNPAAQECSNTSVLSDDDFTLGSTDHVIAVIGLTADALSLSHTPALTDVDPLFLVLGTTFLALSDATSIQGGEILLWGGTGLSWTAGTDVSVRLISATAPAVTDVDVTSAPASADTYGTSEKIEFTVTFDQAVTVTGTPEFEFCLGTTATASCNVGTTPPARRRAALSSGSGTTALVFSYKVMVGDVDDNGIWIGDQTRTIKLGTGVAIEGTVGGLTAVLTHAEEGAQADHKVNGAAADTTPPEVERVTVPISGSEVELIFDEDLDETVVGTLLASVFSLTVAGQAVTIRDYDILATSLALYMQAGTIKQGQTVVVSYTDPTAGDDTVALQDIAGNDVASFTTGMSGVPAVTNDSTSINTAPGAPTGLAATANGPSQIDLAWTAPASTGGSPITGYKIEVSPDGTNWTDLVANTGSTATTYAHTGLDPATTRHYRVSAINAVDTSVPSGSDDATTEANTVTAQTEMVPADWALKPADIDAGEQFRLMFVSSTTRDATSTDIAAYNTFVSTRAAAGVTAIQTYANDFTALVSTETVNARTNTLTRDTDTDAPIYWVRSGTVSANNRVADDYADFYDGTWQNSSNGRTESGGVYGFFNGRLWTGTNTNGTTHATRFMGGSATGETIRWRIQSGSITADNGAISGSQNIVALSPVFQVAATSSDATLSALALEDASDDSAISISPTFASGTTSYTASVDNGVDEITVQPTVNESNATVEYLDSTDTEIADSDSVKTGQQVSLDVGANTIKVKVTAQDTTTTNPYTVVVTRAAAPMQTVVTFISNSAQRSSDFSNAANATAFTTGGNSGGYELSSVDIYLPVGGAAGETPKVEIFEDSAGDPGTLHATLNNPSSFHDFANTFNAPRNTTLRASTTYWLVSSNSAHLDGQLFPVLTGNATADTGSTAGWSIGNARSKSDIRSTLWNSTSARIIFAVKGTVAGSAVTNAAAVGAPTITGAAQVGRTLTAVTTGITDADGLTSSTYTYQWIRVDGTDADIAGANSSTYTLDDADLDKTIRVEVSFTDDQGNSETLISRVYPTSGTVQANNALVSNVGQTTTNAFPLQLSDLAQSFMTGANATGYTLASIELKLDSSDSTATPAVKLYSGSANGTAEATTFTGPPMLDAASSKNYAFTPTSTVTLLGSTTYWVVAEATTDVKWNVTGVSEDTITPATGWSIANNYEFRNANTTGSFTTDPAAEVLQIRVNGTLGGIVLSSDATLSALALEDAADDATITISPVFVSGTTSYTASVDNDVDEITVEPTVNESNATVEYLDSTDTAIADANSGKTGQQVSLDVGANTIKVKVTAQDATTDTYTVVVTRALAMQTVVTFISNSAQLDANSSSIFIRATAFTTGGNSAGYELSSVDIYVPYFVSSSTIPRVEIYEDSGSDPGTLHATLINPSSYQPSAITFNAPRNTTLRAGTTYWLVTSNSAAANGQNFLVSTGSATADTGSAAGWSIGNARSKTIITDTLWTLTTDRIIFAVKGTATGGTATNTAAAGAPTITGTARVGQTLTAVTTGIMDADGLTSPTYTYQWIRVNGTEADIAGANSSTYTLDDADLDKTIRVKVSFDDDEGNSETLISRVYPTSGTVQPSNALVSNLGQSRTNTFRLALSDLAQAFTTGANPAGYTLSSIDLKLDSSDSTNTPTVKLYSGSANGMEEAAFTGPAMLAASTVKNYAFAPSSTVILLGSTTYWVVAEGAVRWVLGGTGEDATPAMGWSIANNYEYRAAALSTGGFTTDPAAEVLQIRVNGTTGGVVTNTAPTAADNTVTTAEDRPYAFMAGDFGFDDDDAGDTLASVKIVTPPALGTLALDGTAVTVNDVVVWDDIEDDKLTFTPARDAHGAPYTTFTFKVNDGTVDSADAYTMTIDVTDAPAPVCTAPSFGDRREIWTGTLTVEEFSFMGSVTGYGFEVTTGISSLPSAEFSIGSNNYTIAGLLVENAGDLILNVAPTTQLTATEKAALRLHVCDEDFDFSVAVNRMDDTRYGWTETLDWSAPVVTRTLYLSLPANNDATGEPAITGTAQVGQALTADASPIMDIDGLPSSFTYKWFRVDSDGTSNEAEISGEIAATYTLTDDDVGKKVKVKVSFTDNLSGEEERTSEATATVVAAGMTACGVPDFGTRREIWSGVVTVKAITSGSDTVGYGFSSTLTNTGGGLAPLVFTIGQNDYTIDGLYVYDTNHATFPGDLLFDLTGNSVSGNLTTAESDVLQVHPCDTGPYAFLGGVAQYAGLTNGYLWSLSLDWSDPVVTRTLYLSLPANHAATGEPTISGTARAGQELTADASPIMDTDGLTGVDFTYQWLRVDADGTSNEEDISGEIAATYTLTDDDEGKKVKVKVSFTDELSGEEERTSAAYPSSGTVTASCAVPTFTGRRKIWTAVLTMGDFTEFPDYSLRGYDSLPDSGDGGGLDPATFTLGVHDYEIDRIALDTTGGANDLNFFTGRGEGRNLWRSSADALRLHVCNTNFDFDDSNYDRSLDSPAISNHLWVETDLDWSGVTTRTVHLSLPLNRPATGAPLITGTATVGQELAVDVTGIKDEDGLHDIEYTYQWVRVDADGTSNEGDITDATADTYTLTDDDLGKKVKIEVSFSDDFGSDEQRTSAPTDTVTGLNSAPVFSQTTPARSIAENTAAGQNVGAAVTATDADAGDTLGYTLGGADAASFDFVETTGQIRTKTNVSYDFEAKSSYTVTVTASDGTATAVATVTISVTDVAEPPSAPATPMVSAVSGSTTSLSVSWAAPANAGKPAIASYGVQYRAGSSGTWSDGPEDVATTTATITSLTANTLYQARVRATNAEGDSGWSDPPGSGRTNSSTNNAPVFDPAMPEREIAENTAAGQNVGAPVTATDADAGDTLSYTLGGADVASFDFVETTGQIRTKTNVSYDFEAKSSYTVTATASDGTSTTDASVTISVTDVAEPPSAPATPMVSAVSGSSTSLSVSWAAPANAGKPAIASYDVQYRAGTSGSWTDGPVNVAATTATVTGLVADTLYQARVRATNAEGDSGWSSPPGSGRTNAPSTSAPGAPRDLGTAPGDGRVTLAWTAPGSDGGAAIEKYRYRVSANAGSSWDPDWTDVPDGADAGDSAADETTFTVSGLINGTEYVFQLRAVNSAGEGPAARAADTPVRPPLPPGSGFLVGNFGQPADGSAQIFVTQDIVGVFTTGARGADLHNIELRLFTRQPNIAVLPIPSVTLYRASVTDSRVRRGERVAALTAVAGSRQPANTAQTVAFAAPSGTRLDAGATYVVVLEHTSYVRVESTTFPAEDAGGAPGWAIDGIGAGNNSPYSYRTTASLLMRVNGTAAGGPVATAPDAPTSLGAAAGDARVRLRWTAPRRDGGAGIEKYQVRYSAGSRVDPDTAWTDVPDGSDSGTSRADERSVTVPDLDNGRQYAFEVRAVNSVRGGAAATATATPAAPRRTGFLVSNFGQPVDGNARISRTQDIVGVFTTGARGGALDSIEFRLFSRSPDVAQLPSVTLYRGSVTDTRATPGTRVATLTAAPGSPRPASSAETITFTAPGGTRLEAGATYLAVLEEYSHVRVESTNASAQDAGGASGWTIDGIGAGNASPYSYRTSGSLLMSVNGTTVAAARQTVREEEDEQEEKAAKDEEEPEEQEPATTPDPDRGISLSTSSSSAIEGEAATISVRRAGPTDRATTVAVQVFDSALTSPWPMDVVFRSGAATATAAVAIGFDGARPASRTVTVSLASVKEPYSVGSPSTLIFNVTDRDAALSVADASVNEGPGATLAFAVTLDRPRDRTVLVRYATSDGTATQGEDYTGVSGTLRFAPGDISKTVSVTVLDDAHDEGSETLTLTLSSSRRAAIDDDTAVGTIVNSDPLPKGWLARFGRTSATQVLGLLDARFDEARAPASQLTLGGHPIKLSGPGGNPQGGADPSGGPVDPSGGPVAPLTPDGDSRGTSDVGNGSAATHTDRAAVPHTAGEPAVAPADPFDALASRYTLDAAARGMADLHNDPVAMHSDPAATPDPAAGAGGEATLPERLAWRLLTQGGWSVDRRQFLSSSSFDLSLSALGRETDGAAIETARVRETPGHWSLWGRGALTRFAGQDTGISLDGDVLTGLLGLDYSRGRWLAGLGLAYNDGDGAYRAPGSGTAGKLDSTLVSVHPYLHYALTERLSAWGTLGYGAGGLRLRPERDGAKAQDTIKTDIQMRMGALGLRGAVFANATTDLALKSDLMWVRTASSATEGLAGVDAADASRVRLLLTGRHRHMLATGAALTPNVELGLRYDDGDAETGAGVELGGGLRYADPVRGLTVEATARSLLAHEDSGYEEWGLSGSLQLDPGRLGRGLSLRLASGWGLTDSGTETLWQQQTASGLTRGAGQTSQGRIRAEWAYGLDVPRTRGLLTPYGSVEMAGGGGRTLALGWRFELGQSLSLRLNGERREALHSTPEHALMLQTTLPW